MAVNKPPIYLVANEVWERGHCYLPFGIMFVGRALKDAGWKVRLFHLHSGEEEILYDAVKCEPPLFVGVSTIIGPTLSRDIAVSRKLKQMGQTVVWGGVFASMVPEMVLKEGFVDFVVKGEAEKSAPRLAEAIFSNTPPRDIPGVGFREGEELRINPGCDWPKDLDRFQPGWELVDLKKYFRRFPGRNDYFWQIFFSRGCPHSCSFCYNRLDEERKLWRTNSLPYWQEQLSYLEKNLPQKIGVLVLAGDNAFGEPARAWEMIESFQRPWSGQARIELVNDEFVRRARDSRAVYLGFGLESGSDRMLKIYNKGITSAQAMAAVEKLAALKAVVDLGIIFFGPDETTDDRRLTVEFMEKARGLNPFLFFAINCFWAFPQTPLWEKVIAQGWRPPKNLDEWAARFIDFMEVYGWTRKKWARTYSVARILYAYPRAGGEPFPAWARKILYRRLHNFQFDWPIEEVLRFAYRNYMRLRGKELGDFAIE
jgi:radical SAM superfamily enzyme YgiQ (UPF0313 family)